MRIFVAVLCPFLATAQQTGRVDGRVVSALDGVPVSRAFVRLIGQTPPAQTSYLETTSSDGRFSAKGLPPGSYQATAERNGFRMVQQGPLLLNVVAGETSKTEIQLVPLAILSGVVTDENGDEVAAAAVRLLRYTVRYGQRMLISMTNGNTDDRGQFRLANVLPGRYYLAVSGPPNNNFAQVNEVRGLSSQTSDLPTYYPSSPDIRGAIMLEVQSANIENLRVRMRRGRTYSIKGTVVGSMIVANGPRPNLNLIPRSGDSGGSQLFAFLRPAGDFEMTGVAPGEYTMVVRFTDPADPVNVTFGRADVVVTNSNLENVTVRMEDNLEVSGKLTIEGFTDLNAYFADMNATRPSAPPGVAQPSRLGSIGLMPSDNSGAYAAEIQIQDDGTFRAKSIPPMSYLMNLSNLPSRTYVKARRLNGQDLSDSRLDLRSTGSIVVLELMLGAKPPSLTFKSPSGIVFAPSVRQTVSVWPTKPGFPDMAGGVRTMSLEPQLGVSPSHLPPGDYFAALWEEAPAQDLIQLPEFLAKFNTLATRVTLKEGETSTVELKVISKDASQKAVAEFP